MSILRLDSHSKVGSELGNSAEQWLRFGCLRRIERKRPNGLQSRQQIIVKVVWDQSVQ